MESLFSQELKRRGLSSIDEADTPSSPQGPSATSSSGRAPGSPYSVLRGAWGGPLASPPTPSAPVPRVKLGQQHAASPIRMR